MLYTDGSLLYPAMGACPRPRRSTFTPAATSVAPGGTVSDGPTWTMASGYTVITAHPLDSATESADVPVPPGGGSVSIFETFEVM